MGGKVLSYAADFHSGPMRRAASALPTPFVSTALSSAIFNINFEMSVTKALTIPEILRSVLRYVPQRTTLNFGLTSHSYLEVALDLLWQFTRLPRIIALLPEGICTSYLTSDTSPKNRFVSQARLWFD
jgi:hypothetical protein